LRSTLKPAAPLGTSNARIAGVAASAWDGEQVQSFYFPIRHQTGEQQLPAHVVVAGDAVYPREPRNPEGVSQQEVLISISLRARVCRSWEFVGTP